ncbi:DinB family protein [Halalkalibacter urbisdiaboli]|uniref:DinB family protein n=1 Tax=Halalkalibacter urbisdiaboli TaxID=1960589 RepID=UPI000B44066B|nr:DinB family protein [Halalkalibacter urbisdiaboli]
MSDVYILNLFADLRKQMLNAISSLSKGQLNHTPKGFSNNVFWQIGHVLTITDELIFTLSGDGSRIPTSYRAYFMTGTSPISWSGKPPDINIIVKELEIQMLEIYEKYDGRLAQPVDDQNNFLRASVIGELFYVLIAHESMHLGMVNAMVKVLEIE